MSEEIPVVIVGGGRDGDCIIYREPLPRRVILEIPSEIPLADSLTSFSEEYIRMDHYSLRTLNVDRKILYFYAEEGLTDYEAFYLLIDGYKTEKGR